ncbi:hypothetical protein [Pseudonocardia alaniniphila]|uniref:Uncharacterized protein n=1 Tax=Pseudonocardia alaniniphila TaxID=75291 RepID=A0ABS9TCZ5_9PSEU|nr:hypothetical protein [Pseudonocardia alaniniphila]
MAQFSRLDCAFTDAGVEGQFGPLTDLGEHVWDHTIEVNLKGVWLSMTYEIAAMLAGTAAPSSTAPATYSCSAFRCAVAA